jgi:secreted trypsin-like serine protease
MRRPAGVRVLPMLLGLLGALAIAPPPAAPAATRTPRVVGGETAPPGAYPWMTGLVFLGESTPFCGGTLIRPDWVLTAAHCFFASSGQQDVFAYNLQVLVGLYVLGASGTRFDVGEIAIHPGFQPVSLSFDYDIALVHLTAASDATPVPTADAAVQASLTEGELLRVLGFGATDPAGTIYPTVLQQADVPYISTAACDLTAIGPVTVRQICAGYPQGGVDACEGDSGGPLLVEPAGIEVGITSFGSGCAEPGLPGVYTEVAAFDAWIGQVAPEPGPELAGSAAGAALLALARRRRRASRPRSRSRGAAPRW